MAFVKLDCGMLNSTLWIDRAARELFITALLMAEPREFTKPEPQLKVRELVETGFVVPPGWYGYVPAAGSGIIHRCGMDQESGIVALERLGEPEAESRTPDFDGRRLVRINGGYLILNYDKYRSKDHTAADRSRRYRERKASRVTPDTSRVTDRSVTQAEAEAYKRKEIKEKKTSRIPDLVGTFPVEFAAEWIHYLDHRKKKKAPMTEHAQELLLAKLSERPKEAMEALGTAMTNGWTGFQWSWIENERCKQTRLESNI